MGRPAYRLKPCPGCGKDHDKNATLCNDCYKDPTKKALADAATAPMLPRVPRAPGSWIVISDPHVPYHSVDAFLHMLRTAEMLGITNLLIAGDFLHMDTLSQFLKRSKTPGLAEEVLQGKVVLDALTSQFERIDIVQGNHDMRIEKALARMGESRQGRRGLELLAAATQVPDLDPNDIAIALLDHFFSNSKVTIHELSRFVINDRWRVMHPKSASRIPPQNERGMARKYRKCILMGHTHLFGVGFEESGTDVCCNLGCMSNDEKFRYKEENPTTYPMPVLGYAAIVTTKSDPQGKIIPFAVHDRWFDLQTITERLG